MRIDQQINTNLSLKTNYAKLHNENEYTAKHTNQKAPMTHKLQNVYF